MMFRSSSILAVGSSGLVTFLPVGRTEVISTLYVPGLGPSDRSTAKEPPRIVPPTTGPFSVGMRVTAPDERGCPSRVTRPETGSRGGPDSPPHPGASIRAKEAVSRPNVRTRGMLS
jgi:hypothetical protein